MQKETLTIENIKKDIHQEIKDSFQAPIIRITKFKRPICYIYKKPHLRTDRFYGFLRLIYKNIYGGFLYEREQYKCWCRD